jgi:hypothetical protein
MIALNKARLSMLAAVFTLLAAGPAFAQSAEDNESLAKQSQNPIANLISLASVPATRSPTISTSSRSIRSRSAV